MLHELVDKILQHITTSIVLENRLHHCWVDTVFGENKDVVCGHLGIGCYKTTWYGIIVVVTLTVPLVSLK